MRFSGSETPNSKKNPPSASRKSIRPARPSCWSPMIWKLYAKPALAPPGFLKGKFRPQTASRKSSAAIKEASREGFPGRLRPFFHHGRRTDGLQAFDRNPSGNRFFLSGPLGG